MGQGRRIACAHRYTFFHRAVKKLNLLQQTLKKMTLFLKNEKRKVLRSIQIGEVLEKPKLPRAQR